MASVLHPNSRTHLLNDRPLMQGGNYVLYWMVSARRTQWNLALQTAIELARTHRKPLVVFEALRHDYPWACSRFHQFVLDGMIDNREALDASPIHYFPYVEPEPGAARGLLSALSANAVVVVTDYKPGFFTTRMQDAAARQSRCQMIRVDDNGVLPLSASLRAWPTAYAFRRHLQKTLPPLLEDLRETEFAQNTSLPRFTGFTEDIENRWPPTNLDGLRKDPTALFPSGPPPVPGIHGGQREAQQKWNRFLVEDLEQYDDNRNAVTRSGTSMMAAYLHFGHISSRRMVSDLLNHHRWTPERLGAETRGSRTGWWGLSSASEAFLDQLVTWRELGHVFCHHVPDYASYSSLPTWARTTLDDHAMDPRPHLYSLNQLDRSRTHDPIWNAAQNQLREQGTIHNYLRMLWGKKILEWSPSPREALTAMIELNNRYAYDGRDPNSYSGIFWCLGRFDRAWGPERPIFGKIRYMSSDNTKRKLKISDYLQRWSQDSSRQERLPL